MNILEPVSREELLREYEIVVGLYIHEDNLAFKIMESSVLLNSVLVAVAKFGPDSPLINILIALIGIALCLGWRRMAVSSLNHHDLRTWRARSIEAKLGRPGTFHDESAIFHYQKPVEFYDLQQPETPQIFKPIRIHRALFTLRALPILFGIVWFVFILVSIAQLMGWL